MLYDQGVAIRIRYPLAITTLQVSPQAELAKTRGEVNLPIQEHEKLKGEIGELKQEIEVSSTQVQGIRIICMLNTHLQMP